MKKDLWAVAGLATMTFWGCSDFYLGGISHGKPINEMPSINDTIYIPKDSIIIDTLLANNDTLIDLTLILKPERYFNFEFELVEQDSLNNYQLYGQSNSDANVSFYIDNSPLFDSLSSIEIEGIYKNQFSKELLVKDTTHVQYQIRANNEAEVTMSLLILLGYESKENKSAKINLDKVQVASLFTNKGIPLKSKSFQWREFSIYKDESLKVVTQRLEGLNTYLITDDQLNQFLNTATLPTNYLARFDSTQFEFDTLFDVNENLVLLSENTSANKVTLDDSIFIAYSIPLN